MAEYISGFFVSDGLGLTSINGVKPLNAWPVCIDGTDQIVMAIWKKGYFPYVEGEMTEAIDSVQVSIVDKALGDAREGVPTTPQLYDKWTADTPVLVGQMLVHEWDVEGVRNVQLYRVLQPHTTQADWEPQNVPALFVKAVPAGVVADWVQPSGAHDSYNIGDKVMYNGEVYESLINANVWSPSGYPAGWVKL
jgi:hypothetical protein